LQDPVQAQVAFWLASRSSADVHIDQSEPIDLQGGQYGHGAFASSQFALRGLAEVLQQELAAYNIRVTFVCPPTKKVMMDGKGKLG
jgi:NAD(P)-dependent dehydrogenase (short-subunit alcohol dehydrogenase family)